MPIVATCGYNLNIPQGATIKDSFLKDVETLESGQYRDPGLATKYLPKKRQVNMVESAPLAKGSADTLPENAPPPWVMVRCVCVFALISCHGDSRLANELDSRESDTDWHTPICECTKTDYTIVAFIAACMNVAFIAWL